MSTGKQPVYSDLFELSLFHPAFRSNMWEYVLKVSFKGREVVIDFNLHEVAGELVPYSELSKAIESSTPIKMSFVLYNRQGESMLTRTGTFARCALKDVSVRGLDEFQYGPNAKKCGLTMTATIVNYEETKK